MKIQYKVLEHRESARADVKVIWICVFEIDDDNNRKVYYA